MGASQCEFVQEHLSAFLDGELEPAEVLRVEQHLTGCEVCSRQLADFREIGGLFRETGLQGAPYPWAAIEAQFNGHFQAQPPATRTWWQSPRIGVAAALAASLLLALGFWATRTQSESDQSASIVSTGNSSPHQHTHGGLPGEAAMDAEHMLEFQLVMDDYLAKLSVDPDLAEDFLLAKYDGQRVTPDQAESLVGYQPLISKGLPAGYELASSSIVKMPCCTCFKAVCRRADGSTLVLFEHDDDGSAWFGKRQTSMTTCGDKACCLVQLDTAIAATWKEGTRSITAVGARDQNEVTSLVQALKQS